MFFSTKNSVPAAATLCRSAEHTVPFACWGSGSAAVPDKERALGFATRCQPWVQNHGLELLGSTEYEQLHGVRRELVLLGGERAMSPCLSPGLTGALLPCRARASGMEKRTNGFKWTFQDIAGLKRVFEWILEVRGHSLRERLCKTKESEFVRKSRCFMKQVPVAEV